MRSSHAFHSLEAEKGPISFNFGHTHTGMVESKSPPGALIQQLLLLLEKISLSISVYPYSIHNSSDFSDFSDFSDLRDIAELVFLTLCVHIFTFIKLN